MQSEDLSNFNIIELPFEEEIKNLKINLVLEDYFEIVEEFICSICNKIVYNPVSCLKCQILFCKNCSEDMRELSKLDSNKKCKNIDIIPIQKSARNLLNKIKFKCLRIEDGCLEIVTYENLEAHLKICIFKKYKCEYCPFISNKEESISHSTNCAHAYLDCINCQEKIHKKKQYLHLTRNCVENLSKNAKLLEAEIRISEKENEDLQNKISKYINPLELIMKNTIEFKINEESIINIFNVFEYHFNLKLLQHKLFDDFEMKYIGNLNSLILSSRFNTNLFLINLQKKDIVNFPFKKCEYIIDHWFIIKSKNIICLVSYKNIRFYNIINEELIEEIDIFINTPKRVIYNEKLNSIIFINDYLIKVYRLYFNEEISIQLITTHGVDFLYGCYFKSDHNFLTINESMMKVINLNVIDSNNCVIMKRDLNYKFFQNINFFFRRKYFCLYTKENSQIILNDDTNLLFINYKNGDFNKIIKNAHNSEIIKLKKAKLNQIRVLLTGDQNNNIKLWDVFNYVLISTFNTGCKIYDIEFAKSDEVILILDDKFNIKGWKLK